MNADDLRSQIQAIWCRILGAPGVEDSDDFFDCGGTSFEAVELIAALREELGLPFSYRSLFDSSTFGGVVRTAVAVGHQAGRSHAARGTADSVAHRDLVLPILPNQAGVLSWQRWLAEHDQPVDPFNLSRIYRIQGDLDIASLERALDALVSRHDALRVSFPANGEAGVQLVHTEARSAFAVEDVAASEVDARVARLRGSLADVQSGMLLRATLFRVQPQHHFVFVIVVPHLVADGWAMTNLTRELEALYRAFVLGQSNPLDALPMMYTDYAREELRWLTTDEASDATWYWRKMLGESGVYPTVALKFQKDVEVGTLSLDVGHYDATIPQATVDGLTSLSSSRSRATGFLAGVMSALALNVVDPNPGIQTAFSRRGALAHQPLVAWLNNSATIRFPITADDSFTRVLAAAEDAMIQALEASKLPFMEMVRRIEPAQFARPPTNDFISVIYDDEFLSGPARELGLHGTIVERIPPPATGHQQSISIRLHPATNGDVGMMLIYDPRQFESADVVAFGDSIRDGIAHALQRPASPIRESFRTIGP